MKKENAQRLKTVIERLIVQGVDREPLGRLLRHYSEAAGWDQDGLTALHKYWKEHGAQMARHLSDRSVWHGANRFNAGIPPKSERAKLFCELGELLKHEGHDKSIVVSPSSTCRS